MRTVTVEIDDREKSPLLFPPQIMYSRAPFKRELVRIRTVRARLPFGDYRLAHRPRACVIERKAGLDELCTNLISRADSPRFRKAWSRFITSCRHPVLLLDETFSSAKLNYGPDSIVDSDVWCEFYKLVFGIPRLHVVWAGRTTSPITRQNLGGRLVSLMLSAPTNTSEDTNVSDVQHSEVVCNVPGQRLVEGSNRSVTD